MNVNSFGQLELDNNRMATQKRVSKVVLGTGAQIAHVRALNMTNVAQMAHIQSAVQQYKVQAINNSLVRNVAALTQAKRQQSQRQQQQHQQQQPQSWLLMHK